MLFPIPHTKEVKAILTSYESGRVSDPDNLKQLIAQSLDADKAEDIKVIDLRGQTAIADYMIVASGRSSRQVAALAEKLQQRLKAAGTRDVRVEGKATSDWVIVDAGDVIVHLFRPEVRDFYNIERMWSMHQPHEVIGGLQAV